MRSNHVRCRAAAGWILCSLLILTSSGCGSDTNGRVAVSGEVTLGGAPLDNGTIEIIAADNSSQAGATITNGAFSIPAEKGLRPGSYVIKIYSSDDVEAPVEAIPGDSLAAPVRTERIPEEFNVASKLTAEIDAQNNVLSFDIP